MATRCKVCLEKLGKTYNMDVEGKNFKCPNCGRTPPISGRVRLTGQEKPYRGPSTLRRYPPPRSADPQRFRTGGVGIGSARGSESWKIPARRPGRRVPRQTVGRFPLEPDFDIFHSQKSYQIIITLPYHKDLGDVRCEVINSTLVVESLLDGFDFLQKFSLPEDISPSSLKTRLKNAILDIRFKKKRTKRKKGEQ